MCTQTISGEINMLDAKNTVLFSTKPNAANIAATTSNVTKSKVSAASCLTACTIWATLSRARTDFINRFHAVCFCAKLKLLKRERIAKHNLRHCNKSIVQSQILLTHIPIHRDRWCSLRWAYYAMHMVSLKRWCHPYPQCPIHLKYLKVPRDDSRRR